MKLVVNETTYELRGGAWLDEVNQCLYDVIGAIGCNGYYLCREIYTNVTFALYLPYYGKFVPRVD